MPFTLVLLLALMLILVPGPLSAADHPFETAMYVSIYNTDNSTWGMTPSNPQYDAYKTSDLDAILSRVKADGFDTIYFLPGYQLGRQAPWKTDLPFLQTAEEWTKADRDIVEELLVAADRHGQKVYLCLLKIVRDDPEWWGRAFPDQRWHDEKGKRVNALLAQAEKVAVPAVREIVRKYGHHKSLVGFGTDEVIYGGSYFGGGLTDDIIGHEALERYRTQYGEDAPSMDPFPGKLTEDMDRLLTVREDIMVEYHDMIGRACRALGKEYTTTLNASMLGKMRWTGLGGEKAIEGSDIWRIGSLDSVCEVATDFYASRLSSHIQADITKFFASPLYGKPVNLVLGTQKGPDLLAKHLMDTLAEGVDRITYWTNVYYYGDTDNRQRMKAPADPDRISYLVKAAKEFRKRVPIEPKYDVALFLNRAWQRAHYRTDDPRQSEIAQMGYAVDALNMAGYRYDIICEDEAAAGGLEGIPAVVVPLGIGITEKALSALERYAAGGGLLIVCGDFGTRTPWGDPIAPELRQRVEKLLVRPRVVHLPKLIGDYDTNKLQETLAAGSVTAHSPLISDKEHLEMAETDYDPYWGPQPSFPVNGKIYDLYWAGDRYKAFSVGHRSSADGSVKAIGRCMTTLRPYQTLIAGICEGDEYDLYFINGDRDVFIKARKVFVFGRDGRWIERRACEDEYPMKLRAPVLVRVP